MKGIVDAVQFQKALSDVYKGAAPDSSLPALGTAKAEFTGSACTLKCEKPRNMEKAQQYLAVLRSGNADFPPLVCVNGMVIDGQHRFWAYQMAGYKTVKIYQNKPWVMPAAA